MSDVKNFGLSGVGTSVMLGKGGPILKNSSGVVAARNTVDGAFAQISAAEPTAAEHVATKAYVDRLASVNVVGQMKNDVARNPGDTGALTPTEGDMIVVTTVGTTWDTIDRLLVYRSAAWTYLFPSGEVAGCRFTSDVAITGGVHTFLADHIYMWDDSGNVWIDVGPSLETANMMSYSKALAFGDGVTNAIKTSCTGRALRVIVNVTQAFNGTAPTMSVGDAGNVARLVATSEVDLKTIGLYVVDCYYSYSATTVNITYTADASGQGAATVELVTGT